jgi:hypothetical protein
MLQDNIRDWDEEQDCRPNKYLTPYDSALSRCMNKRGPDTDLIVNLTLMLSEIID